MLKKRIAAILCLAMMTAFAGCSMGGQGNSGETSLPDVTSVSSLATAESSGDSQEPSQSEDSDSKQNADLADDGNEPAATTPAVTHVDLTDEQTKQIAKAYYSVLSKQYKSIRKFEKYFDRKLCSIYDINGDGIAEMLFIAKDKDRPVFGNLYVYTYDLKTNEPVIAYQKNAILARAAIEGRFYVGASKDGRLIIYYYGGEEPYFEYYSIDITNPQSGTDMVRKKGTSTNKWDSNGDEIYEYTYTRNDEEIKKASYVKLANRMEKSVIKVLLYKNNKFNDPIANGVKHNWIKASELKARLKKGKL